MKSLRVVMLAGFAVMAGFMVQAQTADEIVNKHIDAIGVKEKLAAIKTVTVEYDMDVQGTTGAGTTFLVTGKGYRNEVELAGQKLVQVYTDKGGWGINPFAGQTSPEPLPADELKGAKSNLTPGGPLFDYAAQGNKIELNGTENVNGVAAHKVKLTMSDGPEVIYYIDPNTFYILKSVAKRDVQGQSMEITSTFSDYKKTDYGYVAPGSTEVSFPMFSFTLKTKKIDINKEIDPALFEMK